MKTTLLLVPAFLLAADSYAVSKPLPSAAVVIDGQMVTLAGELEEGSKPGESFFTLRVPTGGLEVGGREGIRITTLSATFNEDPSIAYGFAVTDVGAPSAFAFIFGTPIVATFNPAAVRATFSASFTDASQDGLFAAIPPLGDPDGDGIDEIQVFEAFDGLLKNAGVDVGQAYNFGGAPGSSGSSPAESDGFIPAPGGGPYTALQMTVSVSLSGGGDIYTANGFGEIVTTAVPDGGMTLIFLGAASVGLATFGRFRRR